MLLVLFRVAGILFLFIGQSVDRSIFPAIYSKFTTVFWVAHFIVLLFFLGGALLSILNFIVNYFRPLVVPYVLFICGIFCSWYFIAVVMSSLIQWMMRSVVGRLPLPFPYFLLAPFAGAILLILTIIMSSRAIKLMAFSREWQKQLIINIVVSGSTLLLLGLSFFLVGGA